MPTGRAASLSSRTSGWRSPSSRSTSGGRRPTCSPAGRAFARSSLREAAPPRSRSARGSRWMSGSAPIRDYPSASWTHRGSCGRPPRSPRRSATRGSSPRVEPSARVARSSSIPPRAGPRTCSSSSPRPSPTRPASPPGPSSSRSAPRRRSGRSSREGRDRRASGSTSFCAKGTRWSSSLPSIGARPGPLIDSRPRTAPRFAAAAMGRARNVGEFSDGRGHRVFAATRRIPETAWAIVIEVDRGAALARAREQSVWIALAAGAFFAAVTGAGLAWWRSMRLRHYEKLADARPAVQDPPRTDPGGRSRRRGREGGLRQPRLRRHVRLRAARSSVCR